MKTFLIVLVTILTIPATAMAHGGGLDSNGCHHDRKRGGYHCHRSYYSPPPPPAPPAAKWCYVASPTITICKSTWDACNRSRRATLKRNKNTKVGACVRG
jgi:hypothetical protein